jgi:hypothetical protein
MMKCPVCGKSKSAYEMRPIVNIEELKVGAAMSEEKSEQDVAGARVDVVCRDCWLSLLKNRTKEEVIEILETICGALMEADHRMKEPRAFDGIIEKDNNLFGGKVTLVPCAVPQPLTLPSIGTGDFQLPNGTKIWCGSSSNISLGTQQGVTISNGFMEWYGTFHQGGGSGQNATNLRG